MPEQQKTQTESGSMLITLPDGSRREYAVGATGRQVAESIGAGLARAAVGVKVDGELRDLDRPIDRDAIVAIVTRPKKGTPLAQQDPDALYLVRHSAAHVMAEAIQRLWPETQLAYGPPLDTGFYYDLKLDEPISSDDFARIEQEMRKIIAENRPFTRYELPPEPGMKKLQAEGNKYKLDNAQRALEGGAEALSWYVTGSLDGVEGGVAVLQAPPAAEAWEDLCQGPHVPRTGDVGAFKITTVASSHWHGDVTQDRFQRVYGTAFYYQEDLDAYLEQLEEARQRDHRVIGSKLKLFTIDEQVGQGLVLWKPRGATVRTILQNFLLDELVKRGYEQVYTPHIGKIDLYETSGHYPYYRDSQFPPIQMRDSEEQYLLRPMNCPHHIKVYASEPHSYRDLPIRLAEFGTVYRYEQSGELTGMTRVRGLTQDDAHIFCTPEQVKTEIRSTVDLVQLVLRTFAFDEAQISLSIRDPRTPEKYAGDPSVWDQAERELREVLEETGLPFTPEPGEANFYGPKIDFNVRDVIGRPWQLGTVQLDYNLPERFGIEYVGADNKPHRPVMIHRAPFGSMERFMAILIEHFAGAFPLWLAPEQVRVLPVSEKFRDYAMKVLGTLRGGRFRATLDDSAERVQAKIRIAQEAKVPYMLIVGGRDESAGTVSVRDRSRGDLGALSLQGFMEQLEREAASRGGTVVEV